MRTNAYDVAHRQSLEDPAAFWGAAAEDIHWFRRWDKVLDDSNAPFHRWFVGGTLNTCYNAVDRHVAEGRGAQIALINDSPVTATIRTITYRELRDEVAKFAGVLRSLGVERGDRVVIHMPMIIEGVVAMLATARLGAVHSVMFGGLPAEPLAVQMEQIRPKVVVSASCGYEYDEIVDYMPSLRAALKTLTVEPRCIVFQRPQSPASVAEGEFVDWQEAMAHALPADCVPVAATDPLYILHTSGSTASAPKGVVRDNGGHAVALKWNMKNVYDVAPGDVYWAVSELAWVVGHTNIVYGPLLQGCTSVMFEGKPVRTPDAGAFWRVASQHRVNAFMTTPTRLRMIRAEDPDAKLLKAYDLSSLKHLFVAGERLDNATRDWAQAHLPCPLVDHWWQTETGWAIAANCMGLHPFPFKAGSPTKAAPGWDVQVLDGDGEPVAPGTLGNLACKLPLPPGSLLTLWGADERYWSEYLTRYPGYYATSDAGYVDDEGYVYVMGRTDDIIMVRAHRFSTGAMEEVVSSHPDVAECAVIGAADPMLGQVPVGLLVLKGGVTRPHAAIVAEVLQLAEQRIGAFAEFRKAVVLPQLPKTRSGKIMRGSIRKIADGVPFNIPGSVEDPATLGTLREALAGIGFAAAAA